MTVSYFYTPIPFSPWLEVLVILPFQLVISSVVIVQAVRLCPMPMKNGLDETVDSVKLIVSQL